MKVVLVASLAESLINFRLTLIQKLLERGHEVHCVAPDLTQQSEIESRLTMAGVYCHDWAMARTGLNAFGDIKSLLALVVLFRRIRPTLFLGYTVKPVIYGLIAAKVASVQRRYALITGLGYAFSGDAGRNVVRSLVSFLYRTALKSATGIVFQNRDDLSLFKEKNLFSGEGRAIVVNGSGVDLQEYSLQPIKAGAPSFLLIARLLGDKGVREYVEAARIVRKTNPDVRFHLAGWIDGNPDGITQEELDSWICEGTVLFHGKLSDVRPAIKDCTVYCLPSYREGTPRTVLEAMAMGRAIITTDAPGCRETVEAGVNGFLVQVKSVDDLVKAMRSFIQQPALVEQFGRASRLIAEKKYDVNQVSLEMLSFMQA